MTDWIDALKAECAKSSQAKVAKELGYSAATINIITDDVNVVNYFLNFFQNQPR